MTKDNITTHASNEAEIHAFLLGAVISSCDCLVGFICGERVSKSEIEFQVKSISNMHPKYKEYGMLKGEPLTPKQIVDNRRGYLSRFAYCPYCGEKVNWKQVLSNCV